MTDTPKVRLREARATLEFLSGVAPHHELTNSEALYHADKLHSDGLVGISQDDEGFFYTITDAGRAALKGIEDEQT